MEPLQYCAVEVEAGAAAADAQEAILGPGEDELEDTDARRPRLAAQMSSSGKLRFCCCVILVAATMKYLLMLLRCNVHRRALGCDPGGKRTKWGERRCAAH